MDLGYGDQFIDEDVLVGSAHVEGRATKHHGRNAFHAIEARIGCSHAHVDDRALPHHLFRGIRGARIGWHWTWGITALIIAAGYACLDEIHQAFVASRTATPWDSLLDSIGAFFAYLALFTYFHLRKPSQPRQETTELP